MSTILLYLHLFVVLCIAHPAIAIPIGTGLISLFYNKLDSYPRGHALLSIFVQAGFNLPGILEAFRRLWTGAPPTGGLTVFGKLKGDVTVPRKVPSMPALRFAAMALLVLMLSGCAWWQKHDTQVETLTVDEINCIDNHLNDPPATIVLECGLQSIPDVVSIIDSRRALAKQREAAYRARLLEADGGACK